MKYFFTILFLFIISNLYSQFKVQGIVYDNEGIPMPAVNVTEVGMNPDEVTDADGKFSIVCKSENAVINFSFIGFLSQDVKLNSSEFLTVYLQLDSVLLNERTLCCAPPRHSTIGLSTGFNYAHLGFSIINFTPYLFRINTMLESGIKWRANETSDRYTHIFLRRYSILNIKSTAVGMYGEFERANYSNQEVTNYTIAPDISHHGFIFSLGYTHQSIIDEGTNLKSNGWYFGLSKYLWRHLEIGFSSQLVSDTFQYEIEIVEEIPGTRFVVRVGYQKLYVFNEVSASVAYRIRY